MNGRRKDLEPLKEIDKSIPLEGEKYVHPLKKNSYLQDYNFKTNAIDSLETSDALLAHASLFFILLTKDYFSKKNSQLIGQSSFGE